jgi:hypothetical protein
MHTGHAGPVEQIPVFIQDDSTNKLLGDGIGGLLVLSFLGNFHVSFGFGSMELQPPD